MLGSLNPAALISKMKHKNLRENGTGNLGATNTMLVLGKRFGALVLLVDLAKAFFSVWLARWIAPEMEWLSMAAGTAAVVGHCFPFYLKFKGGKGLAAFAGLVLAYRPTLFLFLLISGTILMLVVNYSFILPFYGALFLTVYVAIHEGELLFLLWSVLAAMLIVIMHFGNLIKAIEGKDRKIREYLKTKWFQ